MEDNEKDGDSLESKRATKWCQPFPFDVRHFPAEVAQPEPIDSGLLVDSSASTRDAFVPSHLPPYPPAYTYKRIASKKRNHEAVVKSSAEGVPDKEKRIAAAKSARQSLARLEDAVDNVE